MKFAIILIVLASVLLIAVVSDAVPAFRGFFTKESLDEPEIGYALNYIPTPDGWPH